MYEVFLKYLTQLIGRRNNLRLHNQVPSKNRMMALIVKFNSFMVSVNRFLFDLGEL